MKSILTKLQDEGLTAAEIAEHSVSLKRREYSLFVAHRYEGWEEIATAKTIIELENLIETTLSKFPLDTPYKVQQRTVLYERMGRTGDENHD
mgnify:CR=1 FL=1|tara:strand:- start:260 stop:535 length:276 start_codon:yes stop_codon:yes gene_type:complete